MIGEIFLVMIIKVECIGKDGRNIKSLEHLLGLI